jgi:AcrR family transcriptional regulator
MSEAPSPAQPASPSQAEIRLLRNTLPILARCGTQQISLRGIARELGVSPSLLVYHFGTHENLIIATMNWAFGDIAERIHGSVEDADNPRAFIDHFLDRVFIGSEENREHLLIYLDLVQYAARHPSFVRMNAIWREHMTGTFVEMIEAGVDFGHFLVDDVDVAARRCRAILDGLLLQWLQDPNWQRKYKQMRTDCTVTMLAILVPPAPPPTSDKK